MSLSWGLGFREHPGAVPWFPCPFVLFDENPLLDLPRQIERCMLNAQLPCSVWHLAILACLRLMTDMRKAMPRDRDKKSMVPMDRPVRPEELQFA